MNTDNSEGPLFTTSAVPQVRTLDYVMLQNVCEVWEEGGGEIAAFLFTKIQIRESNYGYIKSEEGNIIADLTENDV